MPSTEGGKAFVVFQTLFGIGLMGFAVGVLSRHLIAAADNKIEKTVETIQRITQKPQQCTGPKNERK